MIATLAAGSAAVVFAMAVILTALSGFDRGAATAGLVGLLLLALAITLMAANRRPS